MESNTFTPRLPEAVAAEQTRLLLPSHPDWIEPAVEYLRNKALLCGACLESQGHRVMVALQEALANAVVHGNLEISSELKERGDDAFARELAAKAADSTYASRRVEIQVDYNGRRCRWILTDQGKGFDVERVLRGKQEIEQDPEAMLASGRGIIMMRAFMDDVQYEAGGRRLILTLRKAIAEDQRHAPRLPAHERIHVAPVEEDGIVNWDDAYDAMARNISTGGMSILQARLAVTGRVMIGVPTESGFTYLPAEVRHCRALGEDAFELGCQFQQQKPVSGLATEKAVQGLIEGAIGALIERYREQTAPADERRIFQRVSYTARIAIEGKAGQTPHYAYARDLSKGGIAFITTSPLALEERLLLLPEGDEGVLRVKSQIVRCARIMEGFYDVGAQFLALAPDDYAV
jgi:anti-sigma regulatory factor (Ser/Thr protein kinase)